MEFLIFYVHEHVKLYPCMIGSFRRNSLYEIRANVKRQLSR